MTCVRSPSNRRRSRDIVSTVAIILLVASGCSKAERPASVLVALRVRVAENLPLEQLRAAESGDRHRVSTGVRFESLTSAVGLDFSYHNGSEGRRLMSEGTGGGGGWIDFDRDGYWEFYLAQGGVADAAPTVPQPSDRLYRQLDRRLVDVTGAAGIEETKYGQGVAVGDFDNDGFDDILVTNIGGNTFWKNQGDGTFRERSRWSDIAWTGWSTTAAWADVDRDGDLDLYVCNYCDFDPRHPIVCRNAAGMPVQCQPNQVDPVPDHYYENLGDGTFHECAAERGLLGPGNRALGVIVADLVGDDRPEIFVANDASANFLFVEDSRGHYTDQATRFGCALDANGRAQANMGIAIGDYDRNGALDLYVTHFEGEWNTLYKNDHEIGFHDATAETGAVDITLPWVGFGVVWQDFDQDGRDELLIANGHIDDLGRQKVLSMPPQLLSFDGKLWHDVGGPAGPYFHEVRIGRAASEGDFDNDGDLDVVVVHQNSPTELLRNQSQRGHWLACEFVGRQANRRGIGTRVTVTQAGRTLVQELTGGVGYCSSRQPLLIFGLGDNLNSCDIEIRWPSGQRQLLTSVAVDQSLQIVEPITDAISVNSRGER